MNNNRVELTINNYGVAEIVLSRVDKLNALDIEMFKSIKKAILDIKRNKKVRVVIVHGDGPDFSSGLDVKSIMKSPTSMVKLLFKWLPGNANLAQQVSALWRTLSVPVICVIHGRCWGGGLQIALGADFRIAHPDASLSIMESHWGLIPDMAGTLALRQIMSVDQAMQLAMTAEKFDAEKAKSLNIVSELSEEPLMRARELAEQLLEKSPDVLAAIKKLYLNHWQSNDRAILARESWYQVRILTGKNQALAVKKGLGKEATFVKRKNW